MDGELRVVGKGHPEDMSENLISANSESARADESQEVPATSKKVRETVEFATANPDVDQPFAELGLKADEYARIKEILGRRPRCDGGAAIEVVEGDGGGRRSRRQRREILGESDDDRKLQLLDLGPGALVAARWVDDDHGAATHQDAEESCDMKRAVAQHDSHSTGAGKGADLVRVRGQLTPGGPLSFELDRWRSPVEAQNINDAL